jgi:electron transfer flavoprotein alpha subunit
MLALIVVRNGELPAGSDETVAECGGRALLIGSGTATGATGLAGVATDVTTVEAGAFRPGAWADVLAPVLGGEPVVVLPGSPDGRDLAPRLSVALGRPLYAQATRVTPERVELARLAGSELHTVHPEPAFVATLQTGVRGAVWRESEPSPARAIDVDLGSVTTPDAEVLEVLAPDAATIDLTEAPRILGGGAGLDGPERFEQLAALGVALGASVGATRVITDRGWIGHDRQIGTTGVVVAPELYLAFGISGAVQHTSGLGEPEHIVSVNIDPHCPMMQLADLAVVGDANLVLDELVALLAPAEPPSAIAANGATGG